MAEYGFPRARRLTNSADYDTVFEKADYRLNSREFLILARESAGASRVGTIVSKKVAGNAVARNRIRRLIKESFRTDFPLEGLDVVVVARPPIKHQPNKAVFETLAGLWKTLANKRQEQ